jgi:hypothetical protein
MHLFADGATRPLKADVGPTVYFALITRAGNEMLRDDIVKKLGIADTPTTRIERPSPESSKSGK